jgi:hypothetical protein
MANEGTVSDRADQDADEGVEANSGGITMEALAGLSGEEDSSELEGAPKAEVDDDKPKSKEAGKNKEAELPPEWDSARQVEDQAKAHDRKLLEKLHERLTAQEAEIAALRRGESPADTLDTVTTALEAVLDERTELGDSPDKELTSESDQAQYSKAKKRIDARVKDLLDRQKKLLKKAPDPKPATEAAKPEGPKPMTPVEFRAILDEADKEFGPQFRVGASHDAVAELQKRGFKDGNIPTADTVRDVVIRMYAVRKASKPGPKAKPATEPPPKKKAEEQDEEELVPAPRAKSPRDRILFNTNEETAARLKKQIEKRGK